MRIRARKDDNHTDIVGTFRAIGFSVLDTANLGNGAPDLFVSKNNQTWAIEIKDGKKSPSQRKLTPDEVKFKDTWQGLYAIIESVDDVLKLVRER
jgi:Holliday junction resolvase